MSICTSSLSLLCTTSLGRVLCSTSTTSGVHHRSGRPALASAPATRRCKGLWAGGRGGQNSFRRGCHRSVLQRRKIELSRGEVKESSPSEKRSETRKLVHRTLRKRRRVEQRHSWLDSSITCMLDNAAHLGPEVLYLERTSNSGPARHQLNGSALPQLESPASQG